MIKFMPYSISLVEVYLVVLPEVVNISLNSTLILIKIHSKNLLSQFSFSVILVLCNTISCRKHCCKPGKKITFSVIRVFSADVGSIFLHKQIEQVCIHKIKCLSSARFCPCVSKHGACTE